ncbi:MAG: DUF2207 domain-containing protein [Candidatus Paceibacterota bacterium]
MSPGTSGKFQSGVDARVDATTDLLVPRRFCYAGTLGETQSCEAVIATSTYVAFSARFQGLGSGLTIAQELDPKKVEKEIVERVPLWLTLGGSGLIWLVALGWFVYHRKTALRPDVPIVSQYEPPPNCGPMFAGVLIDGRLHSRDITLGLLYLAQQGFISIKHSSDTVALFFTVSDYEITLRRALGEVESEFLLKVLHLPICRKRYGRQYYSFVCAQA